MKLRFSFFTDLIPVVCLAVILSACTTSAKLERHLARADAAYESKDYETARIEYLNVIQLDRENPRANARLGTIFFERGELLSALRFLVIGKQLQPTNLLVRSRLGALLAAGGKYDEARQEAEFVLEKLPGDSESLMVLALTANSTNEITQNLQRLQGLLPSQPSNPGLHLALGQLHQKNRDRRSAEASFQESHRLNPSDPKPAVALAALYWMSGDTNRADQFFQTATKVAPPDSIHILQYADFLLKSSRLPESKQLLENAIKTSPDFLAAHTALAEIALAEKNEEEASRHLGIVLAREPQNRNALLTRARLNLSRQQVKSALEDLEKLSTGAITDPVVQYQLALAYRADGDLAKALAAVDKALAANPNYLEGVLLRTELSLAMGDFNSAIPPLVQITTRVPNLPKAHLLLASAYRVRGTPEDAVAVYNRMATLFTNSPAPHFQMGVIHKQQGRLREARKAYETALAKEPDMVAAVDELIDLDLQETNHVGALQRVQFYIDKYSDKPMPWVLQAKAYAGQKKMKEAEASLRKALELQPDFYFAHKALANLHLQTQQHDQAILQLEGIVARNPKDTGSLLQLAMVHEYLKQYAKATNAYARLVQLNPRIVEALNNYAYLLSEHFNDLTQASSLARQALRVAPYEFASLDTFGWILYKQGDYSQALNYIQQALEKQPEHPEIRYHFGMAHYMSGNENDAKRALEIAVKDSFEFNGKERARSALAVLNTNPKNLTPEDLGLLDAALKAEPKDFFAHLRFAQHHEAKQSWNKAAESYESALAINPRFSPGLIRLAVLKSHYLNDKTGGATLARNAWALTQNPGAALELGPIGLIAGQYVWSLPLLHDAVRAYPNNGSAAYYLALGQYARANLADARQGLERALKCPPFPEMEKAKLLQTLLEFHSNPSTTQAASHAVTALLAKDADFPPAHLVSGMLKESEGQVPAAQQVYSKLSTSNPEFLIAERQLALLQAEHLKDDSAAANRLDNLRALLPNDFQLKKASGKLAYRRGNDREALRLLSDASLNLPDDADLLYHLGLTQFRLKEKSARETLNRALALNGNAPLASQAKEALTALQ